MSDYNTVPLVATGDWIDDAWLNTYIRDNLAALWQYTTAGDMTYALDNNTLTRLAIGSAWRLNISTGTAPSWNTLATLLQNAAMISGQAAGDLFYANAGTTIARRAIAAANQILYSDGTAPQYATLAALIAVQAIVASQAAGDLFYGASGTAISRLAKPGAAVGWLYMTNAGAPGWTGTSVPWGIPRTNAGETAGQIFQQAEIARAYRSSSLASTVITETAIALNAHDQDSVWHDNVTNSERITPITSGRYRTRGQMMITNASGVNIDSITLVIKTSTGVTLGALTIVGFVNGSTIFMNVTGYSFDLTAGQYFYLATSRSNATTSVAIGTTTFLEVERIR